MNWAKEPVHTYIQYMFAVFDLIYLKDVWKWNICFPPIHSHNSQSHIALTLVTFICVCPCYRIFIRACRGFLQGLWMNPYLNMYTSMCIHAGAHRNMGTWFEDLARARSLMQPHRTRQDPMLSTEHTENWLYMSYRLSSPLHQVCTCPSILVRLWIPSQYICLGQYVGSRESKKVRKAVWLKGCIDRLESTGRNLSIAWLSIMVVQLRGGGGHVSVGAWAHHECLRGCAIWYMLVSGEVFLSYCVSACSESQ